MNGPVNVETKTLLQSTWNFQTCKRIRVSARHREVIRCPGGGVPDWSRALLGIV